LLASVKLPWGERGAPGGDECTALSVAPYLPAATPFFKPIII